LSSRVFLSYSSEIPEIYIQKGILGKIKPQGIYTQIKILKNKINNRQFTKVALEPKWEKCFLQLWVICTFAFNIGKNNLLF
jgi:hypothetical protein